MSYDIYLNDPVTGNVYVFTINNKLSPISLVIILMR